MFYSRCPSDRLIRINIHVLSVRSLRGVGHAIALHPSQFRLHHMHNGPPPTNPPLHVHRSSVPREGKVQGNLRRPGFDIRRTHRILSTILPQNAFATLARLPKIRTFRNNHSNPTYAHKHTHTLMQTLSSQAPHMLDCLSLYFKKPIYLHNVHTIRDVCYFCLCRAPKSLSISFFVIDNNQNNKQPTLVPNLALYSAIFLLRLYLSCAVCRVR